MYIKNYLHTYQQQHIMVHHIIPVISTIIYFNFPQNIIINRETLNDVSLIHNIMLSCFSFYIFVALGSFIIEKGIVIENGYYFSFSQFDDILFYFYMSKYVEYIDTFLIYLKGNKPIFLQLYHHSGAVISWHLAYTYKLDCFWIPTLLNAFVHSVMYTYYSLSILKVNFIKIIKKYEQDIFPLTLKFIRLQHSLLNYMRLMIEIVLKSMHFHLVQIQMTK